MIILVRELMGDKIALTAVATSCLTIFHHHTLTVLKIPISLKNVFNEVVKNYQLY